MDCLVDQLVDHLSVKQGVTGSSPVEADSRSGCRGEVPRLVWDQKVGSSILPTPTIIGSNIKWRFEPCHIVIELNN